MLIGVNDVDKEINDWCSQLSQILDKNIHTLYFPLEKTVVDGKTFIKSNNGPFNKSDHCGSRDIFMYNSMILKQVEINQFENRIITRPEMLFENSNTIENNEFIKMFQNALLNVEKERLETSLKPLNTKEIKDLKKVVYSTWFKNQIEITSSKIPRFNDPSSLMNYAQQIHFAPDLTELSTNTDKINIVDEVINQVKKGTFNLDKTLQKYLIDPKKTITQFQANFTPDFFCETIVKNIRY